MTKQVVHDTKWMLELGMHAGRVVFQHSFQSHPFIPAQNLVFARQQWGLRASSNHPGQLPVDRAEDLAGQFIGFA